jgi:hypothetical protein
MKTTLIVEGEVCNIIEKVTNGGKKYKVYQLSSQKEDGTLVFGKVKDYNGTAYKKGEQVKIDAFFKPFLFNNKVYTEIVAVDKQKKDQGKQDQSQVKKA